AEDGLRAATVTGVQPCALPIFAVLSFMLSHAASQASKLAFRPATISAFAVFPATGFAFRSPVIALHVPIWFAMWTMRCPNASISDRKSVVSERSERREARRRTR